MIKLIGCVLIISACTQMGCAMALDKIRQMKYLKLLRRLIFETRAMVEGGMTFGEIILKLSLQKDYSDFTFLSQDTSSPDVRRRITEDIYKSKLFDNEIRQTAIDFFEKLGATDINGQLAYISMSLAALELTDKAPLRPGRFDRRIIVDKPDLKGRVEILKVHAKDVKMDETVDLDAIALATSGAVGSDLANMINEAADHQCSNT